MGEFEDHVKRAEHYLLGKNWVLAEQSISAADALRPLSLEVRELRDSLNGGRVPAWHFRMLNDQRRNRTYKEAIRRVVEAAEDGDDPIETVLDIGTGTGLLAMYAADCPGVQQVMACEANPTMADIAKEAVRENGKEAKVID